MICRRKSARTALFDIVANDDRAVEIHSRCKHHCTALKLFAVRRGNAARFAAACQHLARLTVENGEILLRMRNIQHHVVINRLVFLSAQREHRRPFCRIEHLYLKKSLVCRKPHLSAERIYLSDKVSFCRAAYGRIARHIGNRAVLRAQHKSFFAESRARKRGFHTCVSRAYDNDVKSFHNLAAYAVYIRIYNPCIYLYYI